jgi:hypothetical protein
MKALFLIPLPLIAGLCVMAQAPTPPTSGPPKGPPTYNPRDVVWSNDYTNVVDGVTNTTSIRVIHRDKPVNRKVLVIYPKVKTNMTNDFVRTDEKFVVLLGTNDHAFYSADLEFQ